jgi:L-arabinose isomerase
MKTARVGLIGSPFKGMGDFAVPADVLRETIGVETVLSKPDVMLSLLPKSDDPAVQEELDCDVHNFASDEVDPARRRETARACLAVRRWVAQEKLTAFTMNFLDVNEACGLPTVPFMEASSGMARGIGYAGEGDVLTASLVGALASAFADTTFTEMFCPDWAGNTIFLDHMGEMNTSLVVGKPKLREMDFPWTDVENPILAVGRFRGGEACLVNLAPGPDNTYSMIVAPGEMLSIKGKDNMSDFAHGWFRPEMPISDFLEEYSRSGGTHHLALVYGDVAVDIARFGELMGWPICYLGDGTAI